MYDNISSLMVVINKTDCVLYEIRDKTEGNFADINITIDHCRYLAVSVIWVITACKSVDWAQRKFIVCVVEKVERHAPNTRIASIVPEKSHEFKTWRSRQSEGARSVTLGGNFLACLSLKRVVHIVTTEL
jgi:hypothetical protein